MSEDKKKEQSGGKHLAEKGRSSGSLLKPRKTTPVKKEYKEKHRSEPLKAAPVKDTLDDDFPMGDIESESRSNPAKPAGKSRADAKESGRLIEKTWIKILAAVVTVAVVFGICLAVSGALSPEDEQVGSTPKPADSSASATPAPSATTGPAVISKEDIVSASPSPSPESEAIPSPTPTEEPTPSPTPAEASSLEESTPVIPAILPETEGCEQLLLLDSTGSNGSLMYYEKDAGGWHLLMTCGATLGKNGVSNNKKEGDNTTPSGEYPLLFVYGESKPITQMPFEKLTADSVWVDDSRSKFYNTLQSTGNPDRDWTSCESVYERYFKGGTHKACIYVGYNGDGLTPGTATAGMGSMITICGKTDSLTPTAGCIDIFNTDMTKLLQYLNPERNPVIIID